MECKKCGQVHDRCSGHKKNITPLTPCRRYPKTGSPVCRSHGGGAPQVRNKAQKRAAEDKLGKDLAKLGLRREGVTPSQLLQEVIEYAASDLEFIAKAVQDNPDLGDKWNDTLERAGKLAKAGVDANVSERQVRVEEALAVQLIQQVKESLEVGNVPPDNQKVILGELVQRLRSIGAP